MTTNELQDAPPSVRIKPITPGQFRAAECRRNIFLATIDPSITKDTLCQSQIWMNVSGQLHAMDIVEVMWLDHSQYARLLCLGAGQCFVDMFLLDHWNLPATLTTDPSAAPPGYSVDWCGVVENAQGGWTVRRLSDSVIMTQGHQNRLKALEELMAMSSFK